jgi:hypothetical protein
MKSLLFRKYGSRHDLFGSFLCFNKILFIFLFVCLIEQHQQKICDDCLRI